VDGILYPLFKPVNSKTPPQPPVSTPNIDPSYTSGEAAPIGREVGTITEISVGIGLKKTGSQEGNKDDGPKTKPGGGPETPMDPKVPGAPLTPAPGPIPTPISTPTVPAWTPA